ncbi:MAG: MFS transporter [Gammaproteobacteria bacterium]|nr:MFS transporter [Gammaproteobacteria bacterium]
MTTRRGGGNGMFHGWRILGVTLASQAVQAGLLIYGFGVVILPFAAEFGVPRQTLMLGSTLLSLTTNIISPLGGAAIDRGWTRNLMTFGAVMLALAFLALSRVNAMWQVLAVFALLLPFSNLLLGQLTSSALMTRWFTRLRGRALGLSAVGTSIGGLLVPPIVAQLSVTLGWRTAYAIVGLGALTLLIIPIRAWIVDRPQTIGQLPDGDPVVTIVPGTIVTTPASAAKLTTRELLASLRFWQVTLIIALVAGSYLALIANLVPHATDVGVPAPQAALLMSVMALCAIPGKIAFGMLADRIDLKYAMWLVIGCIMLALCALIVATDFIGLVGASVMLGLAGGGLLPLWGMYVAQGFGQANYGKAAGLMNPAMMPLTLFAAPLAGRVFDQTGHYTQAFVAFLIALAVAAVINLFLRLPPRGSAA